MILLLLITLLLQVLLTLVYTGLYWFVLVVLVSLVRWLPGFSPSGALLGDVHEAHVIMLGELVVVATLALEAGQTGLFHAGLLPE